MISQYRTGRTYSDLFPSRWLPATIAILDEPFNADNRQLNSLGKIVRAKIVERYRDKIEYLYTPEAKNIINSEYISAIRKVLNIKQIAAF